MKVFKSATLIAVVALLPALAVAAPAKKLRKPHVRTQQAAPVYNPENEVRGNAALGGNNANSAFGSNSANENANGRSSGGFGG
jgi:hypothetical protein